MKTILCYGASHTDAYPPTQRLRYPREIRWPGHLQAVLHDSCPKRTTAGHAFVVIEEGCNGRTTVADDPIEGWKNGLDYLKPCLNSHKHVDIVIQMLGTNDIKEVFHQTAKEIAENAGILVDTIQAFTKEKQGFIPKIILVSPPLIGEGMPDSVFSVSFAPRSIEESKLFSENYKIVAEKKNCIFFDAAKYITPSKEDSLPLTEDGHRTLAEELAKVVLQESIEETK